MINFHRFFKRGGGKKKKKKKRKQSPDDKIFDSTYRLRGLPYPSIVLASQWRNA